MKRNTQKFSLNGYGTTLANKIGTSIWGIDSLDKRSSGGDRRSAITDKINTVNSMFETFSNALGNRNPYYIIGEVPKDSSWNGFEEKYINPIGGNGVGAVRAISKLVDGVLQEGVIIDCLGDVDGESSVEFAQSPIMYVTSNVTDSRMRKPASVSAVVAVSNYRSDSVIEQYVDSFARGREVAAGWMTDVLTSNLFYGGNTRAQYALYRLRWLMENGKPFTVYTPHGIYENMLIKSIKPRTDDTKMDMLYATIEFEEIIMYTTYKQTLKGVDTPKDPARSSVSEGSSVGRAVKNAIGDAIKWTGKQLGGQ